MGTLRKINAIWLNIEINRSKLVDVCRYELATYWQNFREIHLTGVKILQKVLGGYGLLFFDSHCICRSHRNITNHHLQGPLPLRNHCCLCCLRTETSSHNCHIIHYKTTRTAHTHTDTCTQVSVIFCVMLNTNVACRPCYN